MPLGGLPFFWDARDRGLHRRTPHPSTFRLHAPAVPATKSGNSGRPMTRNQRFVETINKPRGVRAERLNPKCGSLTNLSTKSGQAQPEPPE